MISVIIPTAGNDPERSVNLLETLHCLHRQSYTDWELLIVEQSLDGNFYRDHLPCDQYIPVQDPENRGISAAWLRNVGARQARGDRLLFIDADAIFDKELLQKVADFRGDPFAYGSEFTVWTNRAQKEQYLQDRNLSPILEELDFIYPKTSSVIILYAERQWYWHTFGGLIENFFRWGWQDMEGISRIGRILDKDPQDFQYLEGVHIAHLHHSNRDRDLEDHNQNMFLAYKKIAARVLFNQLQKAGVGNPQHPSLILPPETIIQTAETH